MPVFFGNCWVAGANFVSAIALCFHVMSMCLVAFCFYQKCICTSIIEEFNVGFFVGFFNPGVCSKIPFK